MDPVSSLMDVPVWCTVDPVRSLIDVGGVAGPRFHRQLADGGDVFFIASACSITIGP